MTAIAIVRNRLPSAAGGGGEVTSFSTNFTGDDENPLSDGGNWAKAANSWQAVRRVGNVARPAALSNNGGASSFDDAYSLCQVLAPADAEVIVTLDRQNATFGELEILLRATSTTTQTSGYEFLCNTGGGVQIVRWNGPIGNFTDITSETHTPGNLVHGDQLRATAIGSALSFYHRRPPTQTWALIGAATDNTFTTGRAGISFFLTPTSGGNIDDLGYSFFQLKAL